jgi:hypothetical protein
VGGGGRSGFSAVRPNPSHTRPGGRPRVARRGGNLVATHWPEATWRGDRCRVGSWNLVHDVIYPRLTLCEMPGIPSQVDTHGHGNNMYTALRIQMYGVHRGSSPHVRTYLAVYQALVQHKLVGAKSSVH